MVLYWVENQWVLTKNQLSTSLMSKTSLKIDFGGKVNPVEIKALKLKYNYPKY